MALTIVRSFRYQILANITGIFVTVVLCKLLVPQSGLSGAAQSFLGGAVATCAVNVISACVAVPFMRLSIIRFTDVNNGKGSKIPSPE